MGLFVEYGGDDVRTPLGLPGVVEVTLGPLEVACSSSKRSVSL